MRPFLSATKSLDSKTAAAQPILTRAGSVFLIAVIYSLSLSIPVFADNNTTDKMIESKPISKEEAALINVPSLPQSQLENIGKLNPEQRRRVFGGVSNLHTGPLNEPKADSAKSMEPQLDLPTPTAPAENPASQPNPTGIAATPLAAGDTIDLQDSVMGVLMKNGNIISDGSIGLPLLGRVSLAGLTIPEARIKLTEAYKAYFTDPQLSLRIVRRHPVRVYLTGAVANPGVYISGKDTRPEALKNQANLGGFNQQFRFYRLYLADTLIMAGGLNYNANVRDIIIHRRYPEKKDLHINVLELFQGGNTIQGGNASQDIALQDQDVIEVPTLSENTLVRDEAIQDFQRSNINNDEFKVSVIGAVTKPGGYPMHESDTVLSAIAKAGGFTPVANPAHVFILHATEQGQLTHREINLQDKKLLGKQPLSQWANLLPNDVIFVDESNSKKIAYFGRDLFLDRIAVAAMFPFFSRLFNK